jgi:hypothetical protein
VPGGDSHDPEGKTMTQTDQITMRVTNIALDHDELPHSVTVVMSKPVADRLNHIFPAVTSEPCTISVQLAAKVARQFGSMPSPDEVVHEIWSCLTGVVFNRFWEAGLDEYEAEQS